MDRYKSIQAFVIVAEQQSFTKAAAILGKTKALLSTQISQLEAQLDVSLFSRSTRSISLTGQGEVFYQQAKHWLEQWDQIEDSLNSRQANMTGSIRFTAPVTFAEQNLMPFIVKFQERYPSINLQIDLTDRHVDIIREGYDFALRIGFLKDSALYAKTIAYCQVGIYINSNYLKKIGGVKKITLENLHQHPFIKDSNQTSQAKWKFEKYFKNGKVQQKHVQSPFSQINKDVGQIEINSAYAAAKLALNSEHLVCLPKFAVNQFVSAQEENYLIELFKHWNMPEIPLQVVYSSNKYQPYCVKQFIESLSQELKSKFS